MPAQGKGHEEGCSSNHSFVRATDSKDSIRYGDFG
ncbi:hypothetical protein TorRG33x02_234360 [Trema orientale]|uniref:Uncharacterized protein n=1 Tax=Trema orientale TaxID=63057 RepID=A0A2P5E4G8_TREOI|nr:hypothetical protein TorRG33x02_234360 [Trema orientale]